MLSTKILNLSDDVTLVMFKKFISFKINNKTFVTITPFKSKLRITLAPPLEELKDFKKKCIDVRDKNKWELGDTRLDIKHEVEIFYSMDLIKQSYDYVS